ncbi:nucleoid-associated protein [Methylobacterium flocculans]|uniref:nucleoid-associated protein n=1 Tax=Methylobacterium flocculans TaxID=2984843 RepID=UPI0021F29A43|nr:nucleoid-associated protein [Methylobacterium sp. FF17]
MIWENLVVDRLIIHEVHKRNIDRKPVAASYGADLLKLGSDGLAIFADRVVSAIGSHSQSMEMTIKKHSPGCLIEKVHGMLGLNDTDFINTSRIFADKLTDAQIAINLPGGLLIVFDGSVGASDRRLIGVIKAETHSGFQRTDNLTAQFVKDLFLTPQAKLYKLGVFVHDGVSSERNLPEGWEITVFDSLMTNSNRDGAAQYIYESFLGCELPSTSSRLNRIFYEGTRKFIDRLDAPPEQKADYVSGLYVYLKVNQSKTISIASFADTSFPTEMRDSYEKHMRSKGFPSTLVEKNLTEINNKLRRRRLSFNRNIQLVGPAEAFEEIVTIQSTEIEVAVGEGKSERRAATSIVIQGNMQERE